MKLDYRPLEPGRHGFRSRRAPTALVVLFLAGAVLALAQRRSWRGGYGESSVGDDVRTAREIDSHSTGTPMWTNAPGFEQDVFTFTRIRYDRGGRWGRGGWATDVPDSDLNLSFRLQQMTSMKVDPNGRILRLTDPDLVNYPFVYVVEPGGFSLSDEEIAALRKYLLNGGFLMFDDFWGQNEWANVEEVMGVVFPDRKFVELLPEHPIYHCVFEIKSKGQVPNVWLGVESQFDGVTWERSDAQEVHHRAIFDDADRMMVFAAHNTDNGDGWEREGENDYYFRTFSEKIAYPLGINVIFYAMTH